MTVSYMGAVGIENAGNLVANGLQVSSPCVDALIVVSAENTNVRTITIQLKDANGKDINYVEEVELVLFADAGRLAYVVTGGSTGIAIGTDGALSTIVAKKVFRATSEADGAIDLTWTDTGTEAAYLGVKLPTGRYVMSSALTNAVMSLLDDVLARLEVLPAGDRQSVIQQALDATKDMVWVPNAGAQTNAFHCDADELFYGGSAGGGKFDLMVGLSLTEHKRSLILRRTNKEASKLFERYRDILGHRDGWNGQESVWRLPDGKVIDIGGCQLEDDKQKYKGTPHDLIGFDEVSDFTESQYTFITIWNRSADAGQRCRVVAAGNPPTRPEGYWVIKYWGPWLDKTHPNPAKPGELRWFLGGVEVDGPGPHLVDGKEVRARSRTFIPAKLDDNPDLAATNYDAVLAGLPEALRLAYREGRFDIEADDDHWQAIPTAWVRAAQERWTAQAPVGVPMCAIGVDVAQGGTDNTVLAIRHDGWFAPLQVVPGAQTPLGSDVAGLVMLKRRDSAKVIIDVGGGWGADAYAHLKENQIDSVGYMGVKVSVNRTVHRQLRFTNTRTEAYWRFREALNPDQQGGSPIMLPDDRELLADLTAPTYAPVPGGIALEAKDKLIKRIGRSPDRGDAVVMAWHSGAKAITDLQNWKDNRVGCSGGRAPQVVMSKPKRK